MRYNLERLLQHRRAPAIVRPELVGETEEKVLLAGRFTVELIDAKTGLIKRHLEFENLIVDAGMNAIGAGTPPASMMIYVAVGTGTTAPAVGQSALVAELAVGLVPRTNANGGIALVQNVDSVNGYTYHRQTYQYTEAQGNGSLTELGLFSASSAGTMWTRQLFKDNLNNPVVVTKTSAEQLRITYELRAYWVASTAGLSVTISGTAYSYTRAPIATTAAGWLSRVFDAYGTISQMTLQALDSSAYIGITATQNSSSLAGGTAPVGAAYVAGTFYRDMTHVYEPAVANFAGGIGSLYNVVNGGQLYQNYFTPTKIPKDSTKRLTLVNRFSWARNP